MLEKRQIVSLAVMSFTLTILLGCRSFQIEKKEAKGKKGPFELAHTWYGEGVIRDWLIIGPFPNPGGRPNCKGWDVDYLKSKGGEDEIKPNPGMIIEYDGNRREWKCYHFEGNVDFLNIPEFSKEGGGYILGYAACYIESDEGKKALLCVGSDDGYKMWLNHEQFADMHVHRGSAPDQEEIEIELNKGRNLLLLKVDTDFGAFNFFLRLTDLEGEPLTGIKIWL